MKRYTFKAQISSLEKVVRISQQLQKMGIPQDDINYDYIPSL